MKFKIFLIIFLMSLSFSSTSYATWNQIVMSPGGALLAFASAHVSPALTGLAVYYGMMPGQTSGVNSSTGAISRGSQVTWVDLADPTATVQSKPLNAGMSLDKFMSMVANATGSGDPLYPLMKVAAADNPVNNDGYTTPDGLFHIPVGQNGSTPGNYTMTYTGSVPSPSYLDPPGITSAYQEGYGTRAFVYNGSGPVSIYRLDPAGGDPPTPSGGPKTPAQVQAALAPSGATGTSPPGTTPVANNFQAELDKMFQDPSYVPTFTNIDGSGYLPPDSSHVMSENQVSAYNSTATSANTAETAAAAATTAAAAGNVAQTKTASGTASAAAAAAAASSAAAPSPVSIAASNAAAAAAAAAAAQVRLANTQAVSVAANGAVTTATATQVTAGTGVANAQDRLTTAQTTLAGDPTNQGLKDAVVVAQRGLDAANNALGNANNALADANTRAAAAAAAADKAKTDAAKGPTTVTGGDAPGAPAAYGDGKTSDFGKRWTEFTTTLKTSGLFSLSNNILRPGSIPSSGTSSFNVDFGRFGRTTFDLAVYSSQIAIIKMLAMFSFTLASLRIVLLKGGGG